MATQETKQLDNIIASRRALLVGGGAALLAGAFMPSAAKAALTPATISDADILNFALNLEYLEAQFYYQAAFGVPIQTAGNALITQAGGANAATGIGIGAGTTLAGPNTVTIKTSSSTKVPFSLAPVAAYATETAVEEGKHVNFLRNALQGAAVAQPPVDLYNSFIALGNVVGVANFDPFANDVSFLIGAYIFEDVGVTAYHGAAPLLTSKSNLQAAASILAVEAYHAGLVRSTLTFLDQTGAAGYLALTQKISQARAAAAKAANVATGVVPDDFGLYPGTYPQPGTTNIPTTGTVSLAGAAGVPATNIADADATNVIAFARTTTQVLNIVTNGQATTAGAKATGLFFPAGMNGNIA